MGLQLVTTGAACALALTGCASVSTIPGPATDIPLEELREVCVPLSDIWPLDSSGGLEEVPDDCRSVVVQRHGINEDSFSNESGDAEGGVATLDLVVAGLLLAQLPTNDAHMSFPQGDLPVQIGAEVSATMDEIGDGADIGEVAGQLITSHSIGFRYVPSLGAYFRYDASSSQILVGPLSQADESKSLAAMATAAGVMHEVGHDFLQGHVDCVVGPTACDNTVDATLGFSALWWAMWLESASGQFSPQACEHEAEGIAGICDQIYSTETFPPCAAPDAVCR